MNYADKPHFASTVIFYRKVNDVLNLCQIEIWSLPNIAKNKQATGSSNHPSAPNHAVAINGEVNWVFGRNGLICAHTATQNNPWWKVDLAETSQILAVTIIGRGQHADRLKNLRIAVSKDNVIPTPQLPSVCGYYDGKLPPYLTMRCPKSTIGRYLSAIIVANSGTLIMCELDVFGYNLNENLILNVIIYNETDYFYIGNVQSKDCNGNIIYTSDISKYKLSIFEIVLKGIDLENNCQKRFINFMTTFYDKNGQETINECQLLDSNDGYFTERDMTDECKYLCNCNTFECISLSMIYLSNFQSYYKELFIYLHY
ncbi:unnamed protein product [Dimorphilus gyrociliatus]|uniref:Fucolectin tachylectin-4 pentraxin-1 domain-containing protein n=1 Tax=Dimorphilus gyrociliatus TaxID=2664684 RepID=A0A7I8WE46_9ANNE|nr:unnamed protein product [Dimorphilus gyrociliatus]